MKRKGSIPDRSWANLAVEGLKLYNLTGNYPVGTWEEQFVNSMWKTRLVEEHLQLSSLGVCGVSTS